MDLDLFFFLIVSPILLVVVVVVVVRTLILGITNLFSKIVDIVLDGWIMNFVLLMLEVRCLIYWICGYCMLDRRIGIDQDK